MGQLALIAAFVLAGLLLWGPALLARRRREAPAADLFAVVAGVAGAGALTFATSLALDLHHGVILAVAVIVSLVLPVPWLLFSFKYTGRDELVSPRTAAVIATLPGVGMLATALIFGSRLLPGLTLPSREAASGIVAVGVALLSLLQWFAILYAGGLVLLGSGVLLWTFHRYEYLDSPTGMLLTTFGTVPWLSLLFGLQVGSINPSALPTTIAVGFLVGGIAACGTLGRYHLFRNVPAAGNVGPTTVVEELSDLMIVTDEEGTVVEINPAVERTLDTTAAEVVGADVDHLLDVSLPDFKGTETVELQAGAGRTLFEPTVSELTDQHGYCFGYAIVLRDVTARTTRQQRLEVFNRVLRHNLRNELTVITGNSKLLRKNVSDPDLVDIIDDIIDTGRDLTNLSEDAREIENRMATAEAVSEDIPLASLARDVLEAAVSGHQGVAHENNVPKDVVVEGPRDLLELALAHLVENSIEHHDSEEAYVEVRADFEPDRTYPLVVSVVDDGPGIPDRERRAIEEETETPLVHGSGLGLWAVRWAVTRLGGEISFGRREPRGTVVSLQLPRAHRTNARVEATSVEVRK